MISIPISHVPVSRLNNFLSALIKDLVPREAC